MWYFSDTPLAIQSKMRVAVFAAKKGADQAGLIMGHKSEPDMGDQSCLFSETTRRGVECSRCSLDHAMIKGNVSKLTGPRVAPT